VFLSVATSCASIGEVRGHGDVDTLMESALFEEDTISASKLLQEGHRLVDAPRALWFRLGRIYRSTDVDFHYFLGHHLRPNDAIKSGQPILHQAVMSGDIIVVRSLLRQGADPNARDANGDTPLHLLDGIGRESIFCGTNLYNNNPHNQILFDPNRDTVEQFFIGKCTAQDSNSVRILRLLLAAGADVNARSNDRQTPLHRVRIPFNRAASRLLIESGADLNAIDSSGQTVMEGLAWDKFEGETLFEFALDRGGRIQDPNKLVKDCIKYDNARAAKTLLSRDVKLLPSDRAKLRALVAKKP
jgi:ankyrin repeat protein